MNLQYYGVVSDQTHPKAFYIVGTDQERMAKILELMAENPKLAYCIIDANDNYSATGLQLSDKSAGHPSLEGIKMLAEFQQARGENSVFRLSPPIREFRM